MLLNTTKANSKKSAIITSNFGSCMPKEMTPNDAAARTKPYTVFPIAVPKINEDIFIELMPDKILIKFVGMNGKIRPDSTKRKPFFSIFFSCFSSFEWANKLGNKKRIDKKMSVLAIVLQIMLYA